MSSIYCCCCQVEAIRSLSLSPPPADTLFKLFHSTKKKPTIMAIIVGKKWKSSHEDLLASNSSTHTQLRGNHATASSGTHYFGGDNHFDEYHQRLVGTIGSFRHKMANLGSASLGRCGRNAPSASLSQKSFYRNTQGLWISLSVHVYPLVCV